MTPPLPGFVQIEPVGQCNLACRMCPVVYRDENGETHGRPPAFMSFDTYCGLLEQFPAIRELQLQGLGEPLLHPRFFDMVSHAAARGIDVSTNTNLTAVSPRRAEQCVTSGLARLHVSLDAADKDAYEYIRTGSRYERVLRNLRSVMQAKARLGALRPEVHLVAVAMRRNLDQLPGLVRLAHEYGVDGLSVQRLCHDFTESSMPDKYRPMRSFVDAESLAAEAPDVVAHWFSRARELAVDLGVRLRLPNHENSPVTTKLRCDWPWRGSYISFTGQAMPCCMVATPDRMNFGNMAHDGVAAIWGSEAYDEFRARLASEEPPDICRGCAIYQGTF